MTKSLTNSEHNFDHLKEPLEIGEHNWSDNTRPLLSIVCTTYNHELFIRDTLDGFLMQKTTFPVEVLIHDDASTDKNASIIKEYENKYPRLFKAIYQTENQYSKGVKVGGLNRKRALGKYIATCEGDDYWQDTNKIQQQVTFLENNPEYVLCFHDAKIIDFEGNILSESKIPETSKRDYTRTDLLKGVTFIPTLTICYRFIREIFDDMPESRNIINGDNFLTSILGQYGEGKYMPQIMPSVYRRHKGGIWSGINSDQKNYNKIRTSFWIYIYHNRKGNYEIAQYHLNNIKKRVESIENENENLVKINSRLSIQLEKKLFQFIEIAFRKYRKIIKGRN